MRNLVIPQKQSRIYIALITIILKTLTLLIKHIG
nr:MAG TPA: hypothetical protein [Caudoviricetes sp.]